MTLEGLLYEIGEMGIRNKAINYSAAGADIYELNPAKIEGYPILFASPTGNHNVKNSTTEFEITLYYLERLLNDSSNDIQIFSTAIEQLENIIRGIGYIDEVLEVSSEYQISNFTDTERMTDRVAGAFCTIRILVVNGDTCFR